MNTKNIFQCNKAFHRFGQVKLNYGGLVLGSDRLPTRAQYNQHSTYSFCARRSRKHKKTDDLTVFLYAFGIYEHKSCPKNVGEIDTNKLRQKNDARFKIGQKQLENNHHASLV